MSLLAGAVLTAGALCLFLLYNQSKPRVRQGAALFDSRAWQLGRDGQVPGRLPARSQMYRDACKRINGHSVLWVLRELGPPDWISDPKRFGATPKPHPGLKGSCILGYFLDPSQESSLCVSVLADSNVEICFESFWDERI